jgi:hypothetical protein
LRRRGVGLVEIEWAKVGRLELDTDGAPRAHSGEGRVDDRFHIIVE